MEDTPTHAEKPAAPATRARKSAARRKTASAPRKSPARRRKAPARKRPAARSRRNGFSSLLNGMAAKAAAAGKEIRTLSGKGAGAARKAWSEVGAKSRKTIHRLTKEWEGMDSARRAQVLAALLAALAAASAPIVRGRLKK